MVGDLPGAEGMTPGVVSLPAGGPGEPYKARPTGRLDHAVGSPARRVAVNVDPRESDPAPMSVDDFRAGVSRLNAAAARQAGTESREQEEDQRLWQYALLLMVVSLAAEGMLGRRLG